MKDNNDWVPPTEVSRDQCLKESQKLLSRPDIPFNEHEDLFRITAVGLEWDLGDMNNSGNIDIFDILLLADYVNSGYFPGSCPQTVSDINSDGNLNVIDVIVLANIIVYP